MDPARATPRDKDTILQLETTFFVVALDFSSALLRGAPRLALPLRGLLKSHHPLQRHISLFHLAGEKTDEIGEVTCSTFDDW